MDSIDLNAADLWDDMDEDDLERELRLVEREAQQSEDENADDAGGNAADAEAVDDDALASLQNLRQAGGAAKRKVQRPRPKLDGMRLMGDLGLPAILETMRGQRWKGKGHEVDDLDQLIRVYEHWGHRMFPKMRFDDIIEKVENLGHKRAVRNLLERVRMDMPLYTGTTDDVPVSPRVSDDDENTAAGVLSNGYDDRWDQLFNEQPVNAQAGGAASPHGDDRTSPVPALPSTTSPPVSDSIDDAQPGSTTQTQLGSNSIDASTASVLSPEVQARIAANRQRALERLRQKQMS